MAARSTYFAHLQSLIGDPSRIAQEKIRLDRVIQVVTAELKARLTPATVPGLLLDLALRDFRRMGPQTGEPVSDFAGQARFLRALCAAVPFATVRPADDPGTDELLERCEVLWRAMFHREMLDDLNAPAASTPDRHRHQMAAMTSLLGVVQEELVYLEQVEERIRRQFGPFSADVIQPAVGLTVEQVVKGFQRVRAVLTDRWHHAADLFLPMQNRYEEWCRRYDAGASSEELDSFGDAPETAEAGRRLQSAFSIMEQLLLFVPQDLAPELGDLSQTFLTTFSFRPGEVNAAITSPTTEDAVRKRPFASLGDGDYALLDVARASYAPLRRLLDCFDTDRKLQRLNKRRDAVLEDDAARFFAAVVQPDIQLRSYYIPLADGKLAERDLLLLKGTCLFLVESKASPLRSVIGRNDKLTRIASDVRRSIQEGYDQACSVIRHLRSSTGAVLVYDSDKLTRQVAATLDGAAIETVLPVVFLDSYYGLIASDLRPWLQVDPEIGYPWAVDRDTFESICLKVDRFEALRDFLLWRRTLHGRAHNEDEAVFAGFFLRHGASEFPVGAHAIQFNAAYADVFEIEYFRRQGVPVEVADESTGPPVISVMSRRGDHLVMEIDGKVVDTINLLTGDSEVKARSPKAARPTYSRRNSACPCGSGKKYKKCCLR